MSSRLARPYRVPVLALTWIGTGSGVIAAVFAVLAWTQARGRPEWELRPTREPDVWVLRRLGHSAAETKTIFNYHGSSVVVQSDRGGLVHDVEPGGELVLTLGHVVLGTHITVEYTTRWRKKPRMWSAPIY